VVADSEQRGLHILKGEFITYGSLGIAQIARTVTLLTLIGNQNDE
jgi:hypothetical protein